MPTKHRAFFGTWHNYPDNWKEIFERFERYTAQLEQAGTAETGVYHVQWCGYFDNARTFDQVRKILPGSHVEKARNWNACVNYCKKKNTAVKGSRISKPEEEDPEDPLEGREYNKIQSEVMKFVNTHPHRDDRSINWIYDERGKAGKSSLCLHLDITRPDVSIFRNAKGNDIKYILMNDVAKNRIKTIIFDFTRDVEIRVCYSVIEELKDRLFIAGKYESKRVRILPVNIVVMANFYPDLDKMSKDRWNIIEVKEEEIEEVNPELDILNDTLDDIINFE